MKRLFPILLTVAVLLLSTQQANAGRIKIFHDIMEGIAGVISYYPYFSISLKTGDSIFSWVMNETMCKKEERKIINSEDALVFRKPNIESKVLGKLDKDDSICVIEENDEWVETYFGWMKKNNF